MLKSKKKHCFYQGFDFNIRGKLRNPILIDFEIVFFSFFTGFKFIIRGSFSPEYQIPPNNKNYP